MLLLIGIITFIYLNRNRRRNKIFSIGSNSNEGNVSRKKLIQFINLKVKSFN